MPESEPNKTVEKMLYATFEHYNSLSIKKIARAWFQGTLPAIRVSDILPPLVDKLKTPDKNEIGQISEFPDNQLAALIGAKDRIPISALSNLLRAEGYADIKAPIGELLGKGFLLVIRDHIYGYKVDTSERELERMLRGSENVIALPGLESIVAAPPSLKQKFDDILQGEIEEIHTPRLHELLEGVERLTVLLHKKKIKLTKGGWIRSNQTGVVEREIISNGDWGLASMIVETAYASSLVVDDDSVLRPNPASPPRRISLEEDIGDLFGSFVDKARWADDTDEKQDDATISFLQEEYNSPKGKDIIEARRFLRNLLKRLENRGWVSVDAFTDLALTLFYDILFPPRDYSYGYYYKDDRKLDTNEQAVQREFIRCFLGRTCFRFGLVEIGRFKNRQKLKPYGRPPRNYQQRSEWEPKPSGIAFRLTGLGASVLCGDSFSRRGEFKPCLQIGADFEIIAPFAQTPPEVHAALSKCCTPVSGHAKDSVRRFKLERESIHNALRSGLSLNDIISVLEKYSGGPLPANVSHTVKDWVGLFGRIKVLRGCDMLEFENLEKRDAFIKKHPKAATAGERFALVPMEPGKQRGTVIDYNLPPIACVTLSRKGRLHIDETKANLIVADEISRYAAFAQTGIYEINQASVSQSMLTPKEIVSHLKSRCSSSVPADLITSIYGWGNAIAPLPMDTVCILQVNDKGVRKGIGARKIIQKCIVGQLSPSLFIMEKKSVTRLKSALLEMGITTDKTLSVSSLSASENREVKISKSVSVISLSGLVSYPTKQTRILLEKAIENNHEAEIFYSVDSRFGFEKLLYRVIPKEIQRYSNRPYLVADYQGDGYNSKLNIFIRDILALRIIEI